MTTTPQARHLSRAPIALRADSCAICTVYTLSAPCVATAVKELLAWIDSMPDMACLVFQPSNGHYEPCDREWLKASVFEHLKRAAEGR